MLKIEAEIVVEILKNHRKNVKVVENVIIANIFTIITKGIVKNVEKS